MLRALTMLLGTGLLVVTATAGPAVLRIRGRAPFVLAGLVIAASTLVITFEALSIVGELQRGWILAAQAAFAAGSAAAWLAAGRPRAPAFPGLPTGPEIAAIARRHPGAAAAVGIAGVAFAINVLLALTVAPNNFDSMTYHLSRVGYWLQYDHMGWFPGGSDRQLANPPNAEVLQAWPIALMESDRLAPFVQLVAAAGAAGAVFMGARMVRFGAAGAAFAAALFSLLPMNVLQATTTQNDMVLASLVVIAAAFGVRGLRDRATGDLAIAALALGLAAGTKGTLAAAAPALAVLFVAAARAYGTPRRTMVAGVALTLVAAAVLGGYQYAVNKHQTGTWTAGLYKAVDRQHAPTPAPTPPPKTNGIEDDGLEGNLVRLAWTFVDLPGYGAPAIERPVRRSGELVAGGLDNGRSFNFSIASAPNEDLASFGPLVPLVLFPLAAFFLFAPGRGRDRRVLVASAGVFMLTFAYLFGWNIYISRLLIVPVALLAPLLAALAGRPGLRTVAITIAVIGALPVLLTNDMKSVFADPLDVRWAGDSTVLAMSRSNQRTVGLPQYRPVIAAVDKELGRSGTLGFIDGNGNSYDYPLFGPRFERRIVRLRPEDLTRARIRKEGIGAVVCAECDLDTMPPAARLLTPIYGFLDAAALRKLPPR